MVTKELVDKYISECSRYIDSTPINFNGIATTILSVESLDKKDRLELLHLINQLIIDCSEGNLGEILSKSSLPPYIFEKCKFTGDITITDPVIQSQSFANAWFYDCKLVLNCSQIMNSAFDGDRIEYSEIIINEGCKTIGPDVFSNTIIVHSKIMLPKSLQTIGSHNWDIYTLDLDVHYNGTIAEWKENVKLTHKSECPFETIICNDGIVKVG